MSLKYEPSSEPLHIPPRLIREMSWWPAVWIQQLVSSHDLAERSRGTVVLSGLGFRVYGLGSRV